MREAWVFHCGEVDYKRKEKVRVKEIEGVKQLKVLRCPENLHIENKGRKNCRNNYVQKLGYWN